MIKTLSIGLMAALSLSAPALAQTYKIGVAAEPYPPFYSPDSAGEWSGWEIDLIDAVCERIEGDCEITPIAWDGLIPALNTGKLDVIMASMSITPARAEQIDFSDKYYDTPTSLTVLKDSSIGVAPESLKGAYVGVQTGTIQEVYANKYYADYAAEIRVYQTLDELLQDLASGRLDAGLADSLAVSPFLASETGAACCESKGAVAKDQEVLGYGIGAGLRKGEDALLEQINAAIAEIRVDGTYASISEGYFDIDIYGE